MKNIIHKTPEEIQAENSQNTNSSLISHGQKLDEVTHTLKALHQTSKDKSIETTGFTGVIQELQGNERKLEEIKSAHLIANKNLKEIKQAIQEDEQLLAMDIGNADLITIQGKDGKDGIKGEKGEKGDPGKDGRDGINGVNGKNGTNGANGIHGRDGINGLDGKDGLDGQDAILEPDEIVNRVNASEKRIDPKRISGLPEVLRVVDQIGKNPSGKMGAGGSQPIVWLSNGVRINDFVTEINISTNITAVYAGNGRVTLTATGGAGSTTYSETPTGLVNGSNKAYTTAHSITTVINLAINGQFIHPAEYSVSGAGFTMVTALDSSLSGTGFTIIYS